MPEAQAYNVDFSLHTLGWKAFQDLCAQVMEEELRSTISVYREAQDGGQDAVFLAKGADGNTCVGTVQCKFSSKQEKRLRASDITAELENVQELVAAGMASVYYFVTSMSVDAGIAADIREKLFAAGVREPHVVGRDWLVGKIKASAKLRALVPRVYGLGDLSSIIDERCAAQTLALLRDHRKSLSVYVPTAPHRTAVDILGKHKLVLLLGAPASGKSTLAAILATLAVDQNDTRVLKCEGPIELRQHWNPEEKNRLYWVDDAFGSNLLMQDYVNAWTEFMPKLKTAVDHGAYFILTSRTHIWNEAKPRIGSRNHPLLASGAAVVEVGNLTQAERVQILYNHLKAGDQSASWKSRVKPHLESLSAERLLLPELARRLGLGAFTSNVHKVPDDLRRFISEPQKFLVQTFQELSNEQRAALTLVFLSQSKLPVHLHPEQDADLVSKSYGVSRAGMTEALSQLSGSLLVRRSDSGNEYWAFWHPTFADAISEILGARPDLMGIYVRGARLETLMAEVVCEGAPHIPNAVVVPRQHRHDLIERLIQTPNEKSANERLFTFLNRRLPQDILHEVLQQAPELLERTGEPSVWHRLRYNEEMKLHATAQSMGLLSEEIRQKDVCTLEDGALSSLDISFLWSEATLSLFKPIELMTFTANILAKLDSEIEESIAARKESADADMDIDSQFEDIDDFLSDISLVTIGSSHSENRRDELSTALALAKEEVEARRSPDDEDDGNFFNTLVSAKQREQLSGRSVFSDVDE